MQDNKNIERSKFTTNLSKDCRDGLLKLRGHLLIPSDNIIIERLVEQELKKYEMDKERTTK